MKFIHQVCQIFHFGARLGNHQVLPGRGSRNSAKTRNESATIKVEAFLKERLLHHSFCWYLPKIQKFQRRLNVKRKTRKQQAQDQWDTGWTIPPFFLVRKNLDCLGFVQKFNDLYPASSNPPQKGTWTSQTLIVKKKILGSKSQKIQPNPMTQTQGTCQ